MDRTEEPKGSPFHPDTTMSNEADLKRGEEIIDKVHRARINAGREEQQAHTSREEAIRNASYHGEMATKSYQAAAFFEANPAFEEFVRLIRCGAIQL